MRSKGLAWLVLLFAVPAFGENHEIKPVDCAQLMAWMAGGVSNRGLNHLLLARGLAFQIKEDSAKALSAAGANASLIGAMRTMAPSSSQAEQTDCPAPLVQAAQLVHLQDYEHAEQILRKLLRADPKNPDLHFALGYVRQQQNDLDDAFDEYSDAKDLQPGFPETHSGLSYLFYRSDDGDNAIAEARTALSMDPQNAQAYRYLGLGLYVAEKYQAALHAFEEALSREPEDAEAYYGIGMTQHAEGKLSAAAEAYRQAIRRNPQFWEAHNNLGMVLHELGKIDEANAEDRQAKHLAPSEARAGTDLGANSH